MRSRMVMFACQAGEAAASCDPCRKAAPSDIHPTEHGRTSGGRCGDRGSGFAAVCLRLAMPAVALAALLFAASVAAQTATVSISYPNPVTEGDRSPKAMLFDVEAANRAAGTTLTVDYTVTDDGSATRGADWSLHSSLSGNTGTITFRDGDPNPQQIRINVLGDRVDEDEETVVIALSNAVGGSISNPSNGGIGRIADNDPDPVASILAQSVGEGPGGGTRNLMFTVALDRPSERMPSVEFGISPEPLAEGQVRASSGVDFRFRPGRLEFATVTEVEKTATVAILGDNVREPDEVVKLRLSNPLRLTIAEDRGTATGVILNDDHRLSFVGNPVVYEGSQDSTATLEYTIRLEPPAFESLDVSYSLTGTANAGEDYVTPAGRTVSFSPGHTTSRFQVEVVGDDTVEVVCEDELQTICDVPTEVAETVVATMFNPLGSPGSTIEFRSGLSSSTGRILDDDHEMWIEPAGAVVEGSEASKQELVYKVRMSPRSDLPVTVQYEVAGGDANPANEQDFTVLSESIILDANEIATSVDVAIVGEDISEFDETVKVTLTGARGRPGGTIRIPPERSVGVGTILDDERPWFSIAAESGEEAAAGTTPLEFTVTSTPAPSATTRVNYIVSGGTATPGEDYRQLEAGTLEFQPGVRTRTIELLMIGDSRPEDDETVEISLSGATRDSQIRVPTAAAIIVDDDFPAFSISSPSVDEGNPDDPVGLEFAVSLNLALTEPTSVDFAISGGTAEGSLDYTLLQAGTLAFAPRVTANTFTIGITGDFDPESDETVEVTLSNPVGAAIDVATGIGTIRDDDKIQVSIGSPSVVEGAAGEETVLEFPVSLSHAVESGRQSVVVGYEVTGGTARAAEASEDGSEAEAGDDYLHLPAGSITFSSGQVERSIAVTVRGDDVGESDETVEITLTLPLGADTDYADIREAVGTGVIFNDDRPALSINSPVGVEAQGEQRGELVFTVRLDPASGTEVAVDFQAVGGTAVADEDYQALVPGTLFFAVGERSKTIRIRTLGDDVLEDPDETVEVRLSRQTGDVVIAEGRDVGTGTILRNRERAMFTATQPVVKEGHGGLASPTEVQYEVRLNEPLSYAVEVDYEMTPADLVVGSGLSGTLRFAPNDTGEMVRVQVAGNQAPEANRQLMLNLSNSRVVVEADGRLRPEIGATVTIATIEDDDPVDRETGLAYALASASRAVASSITGAIWDRSESHRIGSGKFPTLVEERELNAGAFAAGDAGQAAKEVGRILGIQAISPDSATTGLGGQLVDGGVDDYRKWAGLRSIRDLAEGSSFELTLDERSNSLVKLWGKGWRSSYASEIDDEDFAQASSEGDMSTFHLGIDYRPRWDLLVGIALSRSLGNAKFNFEEIELGEGETEIVLTSATPYINFVSVTNFSVWGAFSSGQGRATVKDAAGKVETDLNIIMGAVGFRTGETDVGSMQLAMKLDGFGSFISADEVDDGAELEEVDASAYRGRAAIETVIQRAEELGSVTSALIELGARYDGGDAENGAGADLTLRASYANPSYGLELTGRGDVLLAHSHEEFSEWSVDLGLAYTAGIEGRGLQLSLGPSWNAPLPDTSMWRESGYGFDRREGQQGGPRFDARVAYGADVLRGNALATAFWEAEGIGNTVKERRLRLGTELKGMTLDFDSLRMEVYGEREEEDGLPSEHTVMLEVGLSL